MKCVSILQCKRWSYSQQSLKVQSFGLKKRLNITRCGNEIVADCIFKWPESLTRTIAVRITNSEGFLLRFFKCSNIFRFTHRLAQRRIRVTKQSPMYNIRFMWNQGRAGCRSCYHEGVQLATSHQIILWQRGKTLYGLSYINKIFDNVIRGSQCKNTT